MTESETRPAEQDRVQVDDRVATEPATARALWPTFMRRTLAEDALRAAKPAAGAEAR